MTQLILATHNDHKAKEFRDILPQYSVLSMPVNLKRFFALDFVFCFVEFVWEIKYMRQVETLVGL